MKTILTALDHSEYAEIVLEHGLDHVVRDGDSALHFVTVVASDAERSDAEAWLDRTVREGLDTFGMTGHPYTLHVRRGRPAPAIGALASELHADLLVIGRFHVPSISDVLIDILDCPTLVVGIDGPVLEPQCPACRAVRHETNGETLFCEAHTSDRMPDLTSRLPPSQNIASRMW